MIKFPHTQATQGLQIYVVGGAVRDAVLGLAGVADYDWVVVGASPDELISRGFIPVGAEFPVFLHPETKEEYALARTERKVGLGYKGFSFYADPSVTLEQDLLRRDLTINALAQDENGHIIDPFGGLEDIRNGIFKHVSDAFLEDPVRILRLARFAAQFPHFTVHVSTLELCKNMVYAGEVDALVPERVWAELTKGLKRLKPSRMWQVLQECGALNRILPKFELNGFMLELLDHTSDISQVYQLLQASYEDSPCELSEESLHALRYALMSLMHSDVKALSHSLKVSAQCHDYAQLAHKLLMMGAVWASKDAEQILYHLRQWDVLRKPQRFLELLALVVFIAQSLRTADERPDTIDPYTVNLDLSLAQRWLAFAHSLNEIDAQAISQAYAGSGQQIKHAIQEAQLTLLRERFNLG